MKRVALSATICMTTKAKSRVFKTDWFAKEAGKAGVTDKELCEAIKEVMEGKAVDLGGGVWKKRLLNNTQRSIVLYQYLFAKNESDNIKKDELQWFKKLAKSYEQLTEKQVKDLVAKKEFVEICHGCQAQV